MFYGAPGSETGLMLVKRLIESHFTMGILFTALSVLIFAPSLGWLDLINLGSFAALLFLIAAIPLSGLLLNRRVWMISPMIGFAGTLLSLLYARSFTTTIYPGPCNVTTTNRGYPYWLIHQSTFYTGPCLDLLLPVSSSSTIGFFFFDIGFYMTLSLAVIEFYFGLRKLVIRECSHVIDS